MQPTLVKEICEKIATWRSGHKEWPLEKEFICLLDQTGWPDAVFDINDAEVAGELKRTGGRLVLTNGLEPI